MGGPTGVGVDAANGTMMVVSGRKRVKVEADSELVEHRYDHLLSQLWVSRDLHDRVGRKLGLE